MGSRIQEGAFERLAQEWIPSLHRYEPGRPLEEVARELGIEDVGSIDKLASNENALGPSPKAVEAMQRMATQMHLYPDGGAYYLKQALAARLNVDAEQVLLTNGSNEAIELLGHVFLGPGRGIVMSDGAFVVYRLVADLFGAWVDAAPMVNFTHDLDAMMERIQPETRLVFVANPNNPTGTMVDGPALDRFIDAMPDHVVTVIDEAYIELLPPETRPDTLRYVRDGRQVVVLRTFSKAYGLAGLRLGYAIAPPEAIDLLDRARQPFNANAMAQAAALAALEDDAFLERTRELVADGLLYFTENLAAAGIEIVPSVANFLLVKVGAGRDAFDRLQRKGVIVRAMDGYGLPEYVRVTVGTREENERCLKALLSVREERGDAA